MWAWIRKIPTLGYGKCGGAKRDCSVKKPHDWMDLAFEQHDKDLYKAKNQKDVDKADATLSKALRNGNPKQLSFYGRIYLFFAKFIFKEKRGEKCD